MIFDNAMPRLGSSTLGVIRSARDLWLVLLGTIAGALRGGRPKGEVVGQMYLIGNRSLLFIAVTLGFIGMVMIYQACLQFNRVTGDLSQVGPQFLRLLVHDFGPTLTALMLATRVGAGIAAEIGSMKVTEQLDALRVCGVSPIDYLLAPRFIAALVMTFVLTVFGVVVAFLAGGLTAHFSFQVNPRVFLDLDKVGTTHLVLGLIKTLCYGMTIPVIAGFCGLRAKGTSAGVGNATTAAVIGSSFAIIFLDFVISAIGLLVASDGLVT